MTMGAGTVIPVTLDAGLASDSSQEGERFTASVIGGAESAGLPGGTRFQGVVEEAIPARNGRPGVLTLDIRRLVLPNGTEIAVEARVTSLSGNDVRHLASGRLVARNIGSEQGKWIGIGAGAGMLVATESHGNVFLDAVMGGGAGYLYNQLRERGARNVRLSEGTEFGVRITNTFSFSR
jgi:hypothetical protein